jgi:nucleoside-diphosphate-sugar epimerase
MIVRCARSEATSVRPGKSFLHVDDAARIVADLVAAGRTQKSIYNSGGDVVTLGCFAAEAEELASLSVRCVEPGGEILAVSRVGNARLRTEFGITLASARE